VDSFPHPEVEWGSFCDDIARRNAALPLQWCVATSRHRHWVEVDDLKKAYRATAAFKSTAALAKQSTGCCVVC
jgi:hypothetical protein